MFLRKGILKICSKFTTEHPYRSVISMKLHSNFIEITFLHGCSPVNLLHIFRTLFHKNTSSGLLVFLIPMDCLSINSRIIQVFYQLIKPLFRLSYYNQDLHLPQKCSPTLSKKSNKTFLITSSARKYSTKLSTLFYPIIQSNLVAIS